MKINTKNMNGKYKMSVLEDCTTNRQNHYGINYLILIIDMIRRISLNLVTGVFIPIFFLNSIENAKYGFFGVKIELLVNLLKINLIWFSFRPSEKIVKKSIKRREYLLIESQERLNNVLKKGK